MKPESHDSKPLVTAIVSSYKSARFLPGCLESLAEQSLASRLEVIVVISGSPEAEWEITRSFESNFQNLVMIKTGKREGLYTAWNRAIQIAQGEFLTNANTDDRLHPQALEELWRVLERNPRLGLVYADCLQTEIENESFEQTRSTALLDTQDYCFFDLLRYCFIGPCPMWRRSVHEKIGYFDEQYESAADYDFWLRLGEKFEIEHYRKTLGLYLDQPGSLAHLKIGKDETVTILRRRRETVALDAVFPSLKEHTTQDIVSTAYAALADLCLEGPWPPDSELAIKFLDRAAMNLPNMQIDNNRAVLLAAAGNQSDARSLFAVHERHPRVIHNRRWLDSLVRGTSSLKPMLMRTQHSMVAEARIQHGIDPFLRATAKRRQQRSAPDQPPEHRTVFKRAENKSDNSEPRYPSVLFMQNEHPIDPDGPNGGAEMALIHLARILSTKGCQVTVAGCLKGESGMRSGVAFENMGDSYDYQTALGRLAPKHNVLISSNRGDVTAAAAEYTNLKCRLAWLHVNMPQATGLPAADLNTCCDKIICVSNFQKEVFEQHGVVADKMQVIHNGTAPSVFYSHAGHRDPYRICYAGALVPLKGVHTLLAAFLRIKKRIPQAVLDIFGSADMWGEPEYLDKSQWKGTGVNFHGKVSQQRLADAYSRSSLLVIPSRIELGETFGLGSIDAQACACPVLATACGGLVETLIDGETGRLIEDDSEDALAQAMVEMLMNPLQLRMMGEAGRTRVLRNFLWEHAADRFLSLIREKLSIETYTDLPQKKRPVQLANPALSEVKSVGNCVSATLQVMGK